MQVEPWTYATAATFFFRDICEQFGQCRLQSLEGISIALDHQKKTPSEFLRISLVIDLA